MSMESTSAVSLPLPFSEGIPSILAECNDMVKSISKSATRRKLLKRRVKTTEVLVSATTSTAAPIEGRICVCCGCRCSLDGVVFNVAEATVNVLRTGLGMKQETDPSDEKLPEPIERLFGEE